MNFKGKTAVMFSVMLTLCLVMSACSNSNPAPGTSTDTGTQSTQSTQSTQGTEPAPSTGGDSGQPAGKEPITFTFYNADAIEDDPFTSAVAKKITELTGVTLKIDYPVGGSTERVPLMVSSGDYPDLIYAKGDTPMLHDAGALVMLDDYIENKGANVKKLYGDLLPRIKWSEEDPHYYTLGAYGVNQQIWAVQSSMPIQNAVLKEFGYPKVRTTKDVEDILVKYMEKYPEIDGKKTIGLSLNCDDWHWYIDLSNPSGFLCGYPDNGQWIIDETTFKAEYKFLNDELKEVYRWFNHLNDIGVLDPETFTQKDDDWKAKIANGQVLSIVAPEWEYDSALQTLRQDGKYERTYAHLPITVSEDIQPIGSYDPGWSGSWGIGITTSCKDPERAFEFLDWFASDEAQVLVNWGIEGEHYNYVNGKRELTPEVKTAKVEDPDFKKITGVGSYNYPFPQYGDGVLDSTGNTYTANSPDYIVETYNDAVKETLAAYGAEMWKDLFPPTSSFSLSPFGAAWQVSIPTDSDINIIQQRADEHSQMSLPQTVLCSPDQFDAEWDKFIKGLYDLGIEQCNEEFSKLVEAKANFWKK